MPKASLCRTTSGLEWLAELDGNEIKTLIFLLELESEKQKLVTLGPTNRKDLSEFLKVGINRVSKILKSLQDKGFLIRLNNQELKLNPKGFYKGSSKDVYPRIKEFEKVYNSKMPEELALHANSVVPTRQ